MSEPDSCNITDMRMFTGCCIAALIGFGCLACTPPRVRLIGPRSGIASLAGEWSGSYRGAESGRHGTIWLKLVAGEDHAHGEVVMRAAERLRSYSRSRPSEINTEPEHAQSLSIRFVMLNDGEVAGALEPYWDPDCGCEAYTHFVGRLSGGTVNGTFLTRLARGVVAHGEWSATRRAN